MSKPPVPVRMYNTIEALAQLLGYCQTLWALPFVREEKKSRIAEDGSPALVHSLTLAGIALNLGCDDSTVSTALLHDLCEDAGCSICIDDFCVGDDVKRAVELLTNSFVFPREDMFQALARYYEEILESPAAVICEVIDSCEHLSSMSGTPEDVLARADQVRRYVCPMLHEGMERYPEAKGILFSLDKYLNDVLSAVEAAAQRSPRNEEFLL